MAPDDLSPIDKEIIFLIDTSGSMDGNRIEKLKNTM